MNAHTATLPAIVPHLTPPQLRPARFKDYPRMREMEASRLAATLPEEDWRGLFLDNPLWPRLGKNWSIGWVLEDPAGRVVGSLTNVPSLCRYHGDELICANGRSWAVAPEYAGFALWLMDEYFNQPGADLFLNTTVNENGAATAEALSTRVPAGDWETIAYRVTGYRGFARKALQKMGVPLAGVLGLPVAAGLWVKDTLLASNPSPAAPLPEAERGERRTPPPRPPSPEAERGEPDIEAAAGFDLRFDRFWQELVRQNPNKLLGVRDSRALAWHYAVPLRRGRLWILTASRGGLLRAWCVLKREDRGQGMGRMRLIDYQTLEPDADLLPSLLRAALRWCAAEGICVLEHLGCGLPKMRSLDRYAPYRRKLPSWSYYCRAAQPALAAEMAKVEVWDPSSFDGDASFD